MQSRSNIFIACHEIARRAGIKTFLRMPYIPSQKSPTIPNDLFPVAGYVDCPDTERITTQENMYKRNGVVELWIWAFTGTDVAPISEEPPGSLLQLDDIADKFLDILHTAFSPDNDSILSTGLMITLADGKGWEPLWWYDETEHLGARIHLAYQQFYTPKPQPTTATN